MKVVINTKYAENDEANQQWVRARADTYVLEASTLSDVEVEEFISTYIDRRDNHAQEYCIGWSRRLDDEADDVPVWDAPIRVKKKKGLYFATRDTTRGMYWESWLALKHELWVMHDQQLHPGRKTNYMVEWTTTDGRRGPYLKLKKRLKHVHTKHS
jgi:hypothetical protein